MSYCITLHFCQVSIVPSVVASDTFFPSALFFLILCFLPFFFPLPENRIIHNNGSLYIDIVCSLYTKHVVSFILIIYVKYTTLNSI